MPEYYAVKVNTHSPYCTRCIMSRRKKRRERRDQKRAKKKEELKRYNNIENVSSIKSLYYSAKKASNGVSWKESVQRYLLTPLFKVSRARRDYQKGKDLYF